MIVYHYTTKEASGEITSSGEIRPSNPWTTMDAAYGTGWYFTDLGPDTCEMAIAYRCWGNSNVLNRVQHYLKFDIDGSILEKCRERVYMVREWNKNLIKYLGSYKNKECPSKPCYNCETGKKYK